MKNLRPRHIRTRLALWHAVVVGVVLLTYAFGAIFFQFWQLTKQVYQDEVQDVETAEALLYFGADGNLQMREDYHNHPQSKLLIERLMEVLTPEGTVLYRNERLGNRDLGGKVFPNEGKNSYNKRAVTLSDGTQTLLISHLHAINGRWVLIRLAYKLAPLRHRMLEFGAVLLLALPLALIVAGSAAFELARRALAPLEEMALRTEQITAARLHERLPIENGDDELGHMGRVVNSLLQRLDESFEQLRRFTADASHELRTPLASLRSVGEIGLQKEHSAGQYREIIGSMLEEVTRLTHMVNSLLIISQEDSGRLHLQLSSFSMLDLVQEAANLVDILAEEKDQTLSVVGVPDSFIHSDRVFLRQALVNILDNAVKYSPKGSVIQAIVSRKFREGRVWMELEVIDTGPGIPEKEQGKIFDRFYRLDEGRSKNSGGAGLGLAIARWAVEMCSGTIGVRTADGGGCCIFIQIAADSASTGKRDHDLPGEPSETD